MSEHVHLTQAKHVDRGEVTLHTIVRRKYADAEVEIARGLGYSVEVRYCGDPVCLGDEPPGSLDRLRA